MLLSRRRKFQWKSRCIVIASQMVMKKLWQWLKDSHRLQHLGLGFVYGLGADDCYCAAYGGLGVAGALEFKDWQWGGKPDWIDATLTIAGVMAGYGVRAALGGRAVG